MPDDVERVMCLDQECQPAHFEVWHCERPAQGVKYEVMDEKWTPSPEIGQLPERHIFKVEVKG